MKQISKQLAQVFDLHQQSQRWLTAADVRKCTKVAPRTARLHCKNLADEGILEVRKLFGGFRYRYRPHNESKISDKLREAVEALA
jgi:predicted transcriptional regulator